MMKRRLQSRFYVPIASSLLVLPLACAVAEDGSDNIQSIEQALEADPNCEATEYEAEEMFQSTGGPTNDGWNIWSDGYISTTHDFDGGTTQLTAVVRGQFAGGAAPNMRITVGGEDVYSTAVGASSWTECNFTFEAAAGEQEVRIYFTNDYYQNGQDRNLYVDKLIVGCGVGLCGNGAADPGEECDDGSQTSSDSCKMDCTWNVCGDGVLYNLITDPESPNTEEECDDGNDVDDDDCSNSCALPVCGDEILQEGEQCDDGNNDDGDGCASDCTEEESESICGDNTVDEGEECDDGNDIDDDDCTNACTDPACRDGIVQSGEECDDDNNVDDDGCTNLCTLPACGDDVLQEGEQCDDGNNDDGDGCASDCTSESEPTCGDGIVQSGEECDDGNNVDGDGCSAECTTEESESACGDGTVDEGEECDDGNTADGDGCSAECTVEISASASGVINVTNDWGSGYCATLEIINSAAESTSTWSAVIDLGETATYTAWSGGFSGNTGEVTVTPYSWNSVISAGGSNATVGFCVNYGSESPYASVISVDASY